MQTNRSIVLHTPIKCTSRWENASMCAGKEEFACAYLMRMKSENFGHCVYIGLRIGCVLFYRAKTCENRI